MNKIDGLKVLAIQQAHGCQGQNFYVTNDGIKRDYNLLGGKYEYKIFNNRKAVVIEDGQGKVIEEIRLSQELRDTSNEAFPETPKQKRNQVSTD
jgi:hypothetical protein